jgi:hypothetical protein
LSEQPRVRKEVLQLHERPRDDQSWAARVRSSVLRFYCKRAWRHKDIICTRERVAAVLRENRRRGGRASGARTGDSWKRRWSAEVCFSGQVLPEDAWGYMVLDDWEVNLWRIWSWDFGCGRVFQRKSELIIWSSAVSEEIVASYSRGHEPAGADSLCDSTPILGQTGENRKQN